MVARGVRVGAAQPRQIRDGRGQLVARGVGSRGVQGDDDVAQRVVRISFGLEPGGDGAQRIAAGRAAGGEAHGRP